MKHLAVIVVVAGLAVSPASPRADKTTSAGLVQSTEVVGDRDRLDITQQVRRADGQRPPGLTRLAITFPPGTRLNAARFPRCSLAKLQAKGPSACRAGSRIGFGIVHVQVPFRFPHEFTGALRVFNGTGVARFEQSLLLYVRPQEAGPSLVIPGRWTGSTRAGRQLELQMSHISLMALAGSTFSRRRTNCRRLCPSTNSITK